MKRKTTEEFIADARRVHGDKYNYSKVEYVTKRTKVIITCPIHGDFLQLPSNHLSGHGCPECGRLLVEQQNKLNATSTQDFVAKAKNIHGDKYNYSKVGYINAHTKVCIICPEHGEFWQQPNNHLTGKGCPDCSMMKHKLERTKHISDFIKEATEVHQGKYDYSKVEYKNTHAKVCIICPEHGEFWQTPEHHLLGYGCSKCSHLQSKPELEIIDYLKQYLKPEQIIERDREVLEGREIDILLPDFHVGIEYNGLYWHSYKMKQDINYHRDKMRLANHKGYRLIQIFEDEWIERKEVVLNKLRHVVNGDVGNPTIGARKTVISKINREIAKAFLEQYHIQGYVGSSVYLGAYYRDELVGVMTFTEEQSKMWNLTRFTTKTDYKLPGLANKMFKYFLKNYEHKEIKSFLDLRWNQPLGDSTVYNKLGFELVKMTNPDYRYVVGNERLHKFGFRKDKLHRKYGLPLSMTEREMCNELGFERIYDCGLAKYVYKNPQAEN